MFFRSNERHTTACIAVLLMKNRDSNREIEAFALTFLILPIYLRAKFHHCCATGL